MKQMLCDDCGRALYRVKDYKTMFECGNSSCDLYRIRVIRRGHVDAPELELPVTKAFRLDPSSQAMAVIILDCINTLNQHNLTRDEYMDQWAAMCSKRLNQKVSREELDKLAEQLGVVE